MSFLWLGFDLLNGERGVLDLDLGNTLKVNRFGYIKRAAHGTGLMDYRTMRNTYARTSVDLSNPRFQFLNTFFSISEACMYCQLVDLLDQGKLPATINYRSLYQRVRFGHHSPTTDEIAAAADSLATLVELWQADFAERRPTRTVR